MSGSALPRAPSRARWLTARRRAHGGSSLRWAVAKYENASLNEASQSEEPAQPLVIWRWSFVAGFVAGGFVSAVLIFILHVQLPFAVSPCADATRLPSGSLPEMRAAPVQQESLLDITAAAQSRNRDEMFVDITDLCAAFHASFNDSEALLQLPLMSPRDLQYAASSFALLRAAIDLPHHLGSWAAEQPRLFQSAYPVKELLDALPSRQSLRAASVVHGVIWHLLVRLPPGEMMARAMGWCGINDDGDARLHAADLSAFHTSGRWYACLHGVGHSAYIAAALHMMPAAVRQRYGACHPLASGHLSHSFEDVHGALATCERAPSDELGFLCATGVFHSQNTFLQRDEVELGDAAQLRPRLNSCDGLPFSAACFGFIWWPVVFGRMNGLIPDNQPEPSWRCADLYTLCTTELKESSAAPCIAGLAPFVHYKARCTERVQRRSAALLVDVCLPFLRETLPTSLDTHDANRLHACMAGFLTVTGMWLVEREGGTKWDRAAHLHMLCEPLTATNWTADTQLKQRVHRQCTHLSFWDERPLRSIDTFFFANYGSMKAL